MKKLIFLGFLFLTARLLALTPTPYTLGVSFSSRITGTGSSTMTVYAEGTVAVSDTVSSGTHESAVPTAWLRPGKSYQVNFGASGPNAYDLSFTAPDGYALYLNGVPSDLMSRTGLSGAYSHDYTIELRPVSDTSRRDAGAFSGIDVGKSITWDIGLGGIRTGATAGRVFFKELDLSTNAPANRQRLYYTTPNNYGQITVVRDGPSGQTLKQIMAPQVLVDVLDLTATPNDGYTVRFFDPAQGSWSGSSYSISGSPWRTIKVETPAASQLKITETEGAAVRVSYLALTSGSVSSGVYVWTLQEGDGSTVLRTTTHTSTIPVAGQRDDVVVVRTGGAAGTIVAKTKFHYVTQAWGEELTQVIADPDSAALTTSYDYWTTSTDYGNYRKVKSVVDPTGNWVGYYYYDTWDYRGQLFQEFHPFLDTPSSPVIGAGGTRVISYDYTPDWTGRRRIPFNRPEMINTVASGKTYNTPSLNQVVLGQYYTLNQVDNYTGASAYQRSIVEIMDFRYQNNPDYNGLLWTVKRPDQSQDSYGHDQGSYDPATKVFTYGGGNAYTYWFRTVACHGSTNSAGATSFGGYAVPCTPVYLIPNKSTMDVTIRNFSGLVARTETRVYTGGISFSLMTATDYTYDQAGRLLTQTRDNNVLLTNTYTNGRLTSSIDAAGAETQYTYDALGRVLTAVKKGVAASGSFAAQGDITTTYTYDGANNVTQTVSSGGALSLTSSAVFDLAGRITSSTAPGSYTTGIAYGSGGRIITTTLPGGTTKISENYLDGQPKSLTGTAVVAQFNGFSVNGTTGNVTRQTNFGTSTSTSLNKTTADWLGHSLTEVIPGWNGTDVTRTATYTSGGQIAKVAQPGLADALFTYDTFGTPYRSGLDINGNGTLDLASDDRITEKGWNYFLYGTSWARRDTTSVYAISGSATPTQTEEVQNILVNPAGRLSGVIRYDVFGNGTTSVVDVNRAGKLVYSTTYSPDFAAYTQQISYNALAVSSRDYAGNLALFGFDGLGRQTTAVDPRIGTTTTAYVAGTSQVYTVTDPASILQATYTYDSAGRVSSVKNGLNKYAYTSYTARNEVYRQWGDSVMPVEYGYDNWGHQVTMKTYRGGSGWNASTWPASPGTADTTTWAFQEATGLLASKTDAAGKAVSYTYTQPGQVATRTWARGTVTTYGYSATTAELTSVSYSDGTAPVAQQFNRLGQLTQVSETVSGGLVENFDRCVCGKIITDYLDTTFYGGRRIEYQLHAAADGNKGRTDGYLFKNGSTVEQTIAYGFDSSGRQNGLTADGTAFTYGYTSNSNLVGSIAQSAANWAQSRTYFSNRNLLDVIETKIGTTSKGKFDYGVDNLGRFTSVARTGELFSRYGNGTQGLDTTYGYDDRNEVTSEVTKLGGSATVLTGRDDAYAYDNAMNRAASAGTTHNGNAAGYTANALNQYTQRVVPGVFDVAGAAATGATVTVNGSSSGVTRHGEYFFKGQAMANNPSPVYTTLAVSDGTTTTNLPAFTAGTPESFSYDDDGNLLSDGRWSRTYDAENRLIAMETTAAAYGAGTPRQKLAYRYDPFGRRVGKQVYQYAGGWVLASERRFAYDEWNLIGEFIVSGSSLTGLRTYAWGLDLSGSRQGAGGVGGLLKVTEAGNSYLPIYDGNGNVLGMIKASDGSLAAAYEYDAFGRTLRESGPYTGNPVRYSSKYTDSETGDIYYGYRVYSPALGRFLNRDPKAESGGLNLYAFLGNNGVGQVDYLGLTLIEVCTEKPTMHCQETYYGWHCVSSIIKTCQMVEAPTGTGSADGNGPGNQGSTSNSGGNTGNTSTPQTPTTTPPNVTTNNNDKEREQLKKDCEGLSAQMNDLSTSFGRLGTYQPPQNPMSAAELRTAIRDNAKNQFFGLLDAAATLTPGGFAVEMAGFIASTTQTEKDMLNGNLSATDVALYGASTVNYANAVSKLTLGRAVVTGTLGAAARTAGYVGAGITVVSVFGPPLNEFGARNTGTQPMDSRSLQHEWESNYAPRIDALVKTYNTLGCGEVLGK